MSYYQEWNQKKKEIEKAKDWLSNKDLKDLNGSTYRSCVSIGRESFQFIGQSCCGSQGWHPANNKLKDEIEKVLSLKMVEIAEQAIANMELDCRELGLAAKNEVKLMLESIES